MSARRSFRLALVLAAVAVLSLVFACLPRLARANGRFPASNAVVFDPNDTKSVYVRATFGLLVSHDSGGSWKWICEKGIGFSGVEDPTYVVTPKGAIVGATFEGAAISRDGGCNFELVGGPRANVFVDIAMRPNGEIVAVSSAYDRAGPTGSLYKSAVFVSRDDAHTFTSTGATLDPTLLVETVEIAPNDPAKVYLSAVRGEGASRTAAFLASFDGGATFIERPFKLVRGELAPYIAAVDPTRPERVYVRTGGTVDAASRLVVTDDAGKSWKNAFESPGQLFGFALDASGTRVYAGGRESGVVTAAADTLTFSKFSSIEAHCLGMNGDTLWACSAEKSGFFVGASSGGRSFGAKLHLEDIQPLSCAENSTVARECTKEWPKLRRELGLPDENEKTSAPRSNGPALRGRSERTRRGASPSGIAFAVVAVAGILYFVVKRIRRS